MRCAPKRGYALGAARTLEGRARGAGDGARGRVDDRAPTRSAREGERHGGEHNECARARSQSSPAGYLRGVRSAHHTREYGPPRRGHTGRGVLRHTLALVVWAAAVVALPRTASAQLRADEPGPAAASVTAEVPLEPRPGRVAVEVELTRTPHARVGFDVTDRPTTNNATFTRPEFTREPHPHHCDAPCTGYLRPGTHRIYLDAGTDFAWRVDVSVPDPARVARLRVRLRGHSFAASAPSGPLVIVGTVAALAGPAAIIVGAATGDHTVPTELWVTGSALFFGGAAALGLGIGLYLYGSPAVASVEAVTAQPGEAPQARGTSHRGRTALLPTLGGLHLVHRW